MCKMKLWNKLWYPRVLVSSSALFHVHASNFIANFMNLYIYGILDTNLPKMCGAYRVILKSNS